MKTIISNEAKLNTIIKTVLQEIEFYNRRSLQIQVVYEKGKALELIITELNPFQNGISGGYDFGVADDFIRGLSRVGIECSGSKYWSKESGIIHFGYAPLSEDAYYSKGKLQYLECGYLKLRMNVRAEFLNSKKEIDETAIN